MSWGFLGGLLEISQPHLSSSRNGDGSILGGSAKISAPCITRRSLLFSINPHPTFFFLKLRFGAFRCVRGAPGPARNWCCEEEEGGAG